MNKFTKLILTSAVFATSGFATDLTNIAEGATLNVSGSVTANTDVSVNGTVNIKGGSVVNNAIMTYGADSSLVIENLDNVYKAGAFYLKITDVKKNGSSTGEFIPLSDFSSRFELNKWTFYPNTGEKIDHTKPADSQDSTWSQDRGTNTNNGCFSILVDFNVTDIEEELQKLDEAKEAGLSGFTFDYELYSDRTCTTAIDRENMNAGTTSSTGTFTQNSDANTEIKTTTYADCFPTKGVVDLSEATNANQTTFKGGEITGGTVKLKHDTGIFTGLSLSSKDETPIVGVYENDASAATQLQTIVAETYIKPKNEATDTGTPEEQFKSEFKDGTQIKLNPTFTGYTDVPGATATTGLYLFADPTTKASDGRKDFPGLLADTGNLNKSEYKLKTEDIVYEEGSNDPNYGKSAIIGLKTNDSSTLAVTTTEDSTPIINIGFEGSGDLTFAGYDTTTAGDGTTIDYDTELPVSSLTFSGNNSGYDGTAAFGPQVKKVVASGDNTLPKNFSQIKGELENKTGANTICSPGSKVNSLTITAGTLTVSTGSTLSIGNI